MSAPESILNKIKLLLKLTKSPNLNESDNARKMADKLISKYNITEEELKTLEDKQPLYGEDERVFTTMGVVGWRQQLILAIGTHFDCQIVQEEIVPVEGLHEFTYFAYGHPDDVNNVKFVYHVFSNKVDNLIDTRCIGRGAIYISSYSEGVAEAIKNNIIMDGIDLPLAKIPIRPIETGKTLNNGTSNLVKTKEEKERPADATVDVNAHSLIKDIGAYFRGIDDGKSISLNDILELEVENEKLKEFDNV